MKMNNVEIRDARPKDARAISEVFYKTWLVTYPNKEAGITKEDIENKFKGFDKPENVAKREERIKNLPANEKQFVALFEGKIIAISSMVKHQDKNQLQAMYVLPRYQGKGVGKILWEEGKKFFDLKLPTIVQVATYNKQAIGFYEKLGFKDGGKRLAEERFRMKSGSIIPEMEMIIEAGH